MASCVPRDARFNPTCHVNLISNKPFFARSSFGLRSRVGLMLFTFSITILTWPYDFLVNFFPNAIRRSLDFPPSALVYVSLVDTCGRALDFYSCFAERALPHDNGIGVVSSFCQVYGFFLLLQKLFLFPIYFSDRFNIVTKS